MANTITKEKLLEQFECFKVRDVDAIAQLRDSGLGNTLEARIQFNQERLADVMVLLGMTIRYITRDQE